MDKTKNRLL